MLALMEPETRNAPVTSSALKRVAARLMGIALAVLLGGFIVLAALQTQLIFPGSATQRTPEAELPVGTGGKVVALNSASGDRITALFGKALNPDGSPHRDAAKQPTLLYFYGNGMCLAAAAEFDFDRYRRLGVNVLIPDYLGYGLSSGKASETGCYQTADACYDHLLKRDDVDPRKIVIVGRSLGGAVAIDLAARRNVAGLVTFSTFTSMTAMTHLRFPFAPTILLRHKFDSMSKIRRIACPILMGHGSEDTIVPATMSRTLAGAATKARVTSFVVAGAEHNDFDYQVGNQQITQELTKFLASLDTL